MRKNAEHLIHIDSIHLLVQQRTLLLLPLFEYSLHPRKILNLLFYLVSLNLCDVGCLFSCFSNSIPPIHGDKPSAVPVSVLIQPSWTLSAAYAPLAEVSLSSTAVFDSANLCPKYPITCLSFSLFCYISTEWVVQSPLGWISFVLVCLQYRHLYLSWSSWTPLIVP